MKKNVILGNNAVGYTLRGNRYEVMFPRYSTFKIIGNTVIADVSNNKKNRALNYKVVSKVEDRIVSVFDCSEVEVLDNGNLKLTLLRDSKGDFRSLIFDPEKGKAVSRVYDGMTYVRDDKLFLCKLTVENIDRGKFNYFLKINADGDVVTDLFNEYTGEIVPYEKMVVDENLTFRKMEEKASKNYIVCYNLERKAPVISKV